ncbi:MAG: PfkB family carbohydrate kinase [Candidatus Thorarchaeota archaeon]|nr:PfkB family carbohydrate kinase [Candidatus Thorarchaeota archaeon]
MYDLVVIGSPSYDRFVRPSSNNGRQLSGPAIFSARCAVQLGIENMAIVGPISSQYLDQYAIYLDKLGIPEYYPINSLDTGGFELNYNGGIEPDYISVLGVPKTIGIRDIPDEFLSSQIIILSPLLQEISAELIEWICNSSDATILLDPQLRDINSEGKLAVVSELQVIEKTRSFLDFIKPNEREALLITGEEDMFLAAELLVESLAESCIITLGEKGSLIYDGNMFTIVPAFPTQAKDAFCAGASFLAGFALGLLEERSIVNCAALGAAVASEKVERTGLDFNLIRSDVERRAAQIAHDSETR